MEITITTAIILIAVGIAMALFKSFLFKIRVRPEFDSKAVDLWDQRHFTKRDPELSDEEKCIKFIELDVEAKQLLEVIKKDNGRKGIKNPLAK